MEKRSRENCLGSLEFLSYLTGAAGAEEKEIIEQHLGDCDFCFESFIGAFNQHLDQTSMPIGRAHHAMPWSQFSL
ncbi:MAG: hypothetical protein ONB44_04025 [candidate division KSB1 bacterium]|nr:hypothetical protein [candidate division KSB1 bacterium]MDZ7301298.1 hypothetical protein [candidate division KSB1 bacterium]MDZ7310817.1 hypothetical protein [candidate division KSB1 bacterium]